MTELRKLKRRQDKVEKTKGDKEVADVTLDETITELEAQRDLIKKLKDEHPDDIKKLHDEAANKINEAIEGLKKLKKGGTLPPGIEGKIEKAIRDAADAIDKADTKRSPKSLTLERIVKTLRDIAANLF